MFQTPLIQIRFGISVFFIWLRFVSDFELRISDFLFEGEKR